MLREVRPSVVFLCETRLMAAKMNCISMTLGLDNCLDIDLVSFWSGLALLWKKKAQVVVISYSTHHVDVIAKIEKGLWRRFIGIYGHLDTTMKTHAWELVRCLYSLSSLPWIIE